MGLVFTLCQRIIHKMLCCLGLVNLCVGVVYPVTKTVEFVRGSDRDAVGAGKQWAVYWTLFLLMSTFERCLSSAISRSALYGALKALILSWLVHPNYQGAAYLWNEHLELPYDQAAQCFRQYYSRLVGFIVKAADVGAKDGVSDGNEVAEADK